MFCLEDVYNRINHQFPFLVTLQCQCVIFCTPVCHYLSLPLQKLCIFVLPDIQNKFFDFYLTVMFFKWVKEQAGSMGPHAQTWHAEAQDKLTIRDDSNGMKRENRNEGK